jgi:hemoglobin
MHTKPDISSFEDIKLLLDTFYAKVLKDDLISYIFTDIAQIQLETHMPHLYAFWDTVLFGTANYKGNPVLKHIELDKKEPLTDAHFTQWKKLFFETIDELFEGKKAAFAKEKATAMEFLMKMKIDASRKPGFIQ